MNALRICCCGAVAAVAMGMALFSCDEKDMGQASFGLIQERIFKTSCTLSGCHSSTDDDSYVQHQLLLTDGEAYDALVGHASTNADAKLDNLLRVKAGDAHSSLLYQKLAASSHHTKTYGSPMPLGLALLTVGQVEFIRQWIEAGAPREGQAADPSLLDDKTPQEENFVPLQAPQAGHGLQLNVSKFTVAPNFERELFVYQKVGNTEDIYVNRIEIKMRQNSHHFILYDFNTSLPEIFRPTNDLIRDIRNADGTMNIGYMVPMAYHTFIVGTQTPYLDYQLPDGVAILFKSNMSVDCNSHYVNKSAVEIPGEINVNLHTVPASAVTKVAKVINLPNENLNLPAKQRVTLTKSWTFDKSVSILSLTSHTHKLAEKFVIKIKGGARNGEVVYTNLDWHHPPLINLSPPIQMSPGEGLTSEITYNNVTDLPVKFGLTSEDEMGIIFGYYVEN